MKAGELNEDARKVIAAGRAGHEASELVRARVRRSVATNMARGVVAVSMVHASSLLAATGKITVALALAGGAGAGAWYALSQPQPELPPQVALATKQPSSAKPSQPKADTAKQTAPAPVETSSEAAKSNDEAEQAAARQRLSAKPRVSSQEAEVVKNRASDLSREIALLAEASAKLNQGDAAGAHRVLRRYDREVSDKLLVQERAATGVLVHCGLGNVQAARRAAQRFHEAWPRSPLASRIAGSCAGDARKF